MGRLFNKTGFGYGAAQTQGSFGSVGTVNVVNSTPDPLFISCYAWGSASATAITLVIDGMTHGTGTFGPGSDSDFFSGIIPPGKTASIITAGGGYTGGVYTLKG